MVFFWSPNLGMLSEHWVVLVPVIRTIKAPLECPLGLIPEVKRG